MFENIEEEIVEAENVLNETGYGLPIAWALLWMVDNKNEISSALSGAPSLEQEFNAIVSNIGG